MPTTNEVIDDSTQKFQINFWNQRLKNLESIFDQLRDPRIKKMAIVLEITESSYTLTFKTFFRNLVAGIPTYCKSNANILLSNATFHIFYVLEKFSF